MSAKKYESLISPLEQSSTQEYWMFEQMRMERHLIHKPRAVMGDQRKRELPDGSEDASDVPESSVAPFSSPCFLGQ